MKKLVSFALALIMVLSLCSFASAEEPTLVRFWHNRSSGANLEACEKAVDEFNNTIGKEKNIHVEATYIGGYPELYSKCQLASQTDEVPTVAVVWQHLHRAACSRMSCWPIWLPTPRRPVSM